MISMVDAAQVSELPLSDWLSPLLSSRLVHRLEMDLPSLAEGKMIGRSVAKVGD